ncbi:MAG TPA: DUF116 domain-containing protein [Gemmatimonadales bacterium]|nr:DUF116 domain-containing protein [Gemmatimonadales bacterium]
MPSTAQAKPNLIRIEVDRRLGHEWDEWDGRPLPGGGNFDTPPRRFFAYAALTLAVVAGSLYLALYLLGPRLATLWAPLPRALVLALSALTVIAWAWFVLLAASYYGPALLLPERLAERGPFLALMRWTSQVARRFGVRDWVEHAAVEVYNGLASRRGRKVGKGELLVLIPRCLSKEALDGILDVAGRYDVPVFVATRGQLARRAIRERRPRAVVAVACERDMVSGLHDVAAKVPVLGLTMRLPSGPCKDAAVDVAKLESWVKSFVEAG